MLAVAVACLLATASALQVFDLGGSDWTLTNSAGNVSVAANVPGQVHLDLLNAGVIKVRCVADRRRALARVPLTMHASPCRASP